MSIGENPDTQPQDFVVGPVVSQLYYLPTNLADVDLEEINLKHLKMDDRVAEQIRDFHAKQLVRDLHRMDTQWRAVLLRR